LPGEPKVYARSVRPEGQRYGVTNMKKTREVAFALWMEALRREAQRQARTRVRFQYLHKLKLFRRQLEQSKAQLHEAVRIERRRCARRLRMLRAAMERAKEREVVALRLQANKTISEQKAELTKQIRVCKWRITRLLSQKKDRSEVAVAVASSDNVKERHKTMKRPSRPRHVVQARVHTTGRKKLPSKPKRIVEQLPGSGTEQAAVFTQVQAELDKAVTAIRRTAHCECCLCNGVIEDDLVRIDSGQRLCPACYSAFQQKVAQIELTEGPAAEPQTHP
jgi:hypothetical protein